jgi:hypothetical protein
MAVEPSHLGSDDSQTVLLQEAPGHEEPRQWRRYRLEPDEYRVID